MRSESVGLATLVFGFKEAAGFGEGEEVAVDLELILSAVVGDRDDVTYVVAAMAEEVGYQVNVNVMLHGWVLVPFMEGDAALRRSVSLLARSKESFRVRFAEPGPYYDGTVGLGSCNCGVRSKAVLG